MCFFGFFRCGEIVIPSDSTFEHGVHLAYRDVRVNDAVQPRFVEVHLKALKADPFHLGVSVYLCCTSKNLCPVAAILAYSVERGSEPGHFFRFEDGRPLTRVRFVNAVRSVLVKAGLNAQCYLGHSFRIRAAMTAAAEGVPDLMI